MDNATITANRLEYLRGLVTIITSDTNDDDRSITEDELLVYLILKFEHDVSKRSRLKRFILIVDQMFNVLLWNGSQDETISSHLARRITIGKATWFDKLICKGLHLLESKHCRKSVGE